jgi:hypothetical protein
MVAALTTWRNNASGIVSGLRRDDVRRRVVLVGACNGNPVAAGVFQPNPSSVRTIAGLLG